MLKFNDDSCFPHKAARLQYARNSISAEALPQTPLGELTVPPNIPPIAGFRGREGEEKGNTGGRKREGGKGRGDFSTASLFY